MPKYRLKNGKYVIVSEDNLEAFKASNDFEGATLFEEAPKKAIDPVKEAAIVGSKNQAANGVYSSENGSLERPKDNYYEVGGNKYTAFDIEASRNTSRPIRMEDMYEIDGAKYYADELQPHIGKLSIEQYLKRLQGSRKHKVKVHKYKEINVAEDTMTTLYNELDPIIVKAKRPEVLSYKNKEGGTSYMSKDKYNMLKNIHQNLQKNASDISEEEITDRAVKRYFDIDNIKNRNAQLKYGEGKYVEFLPEFETDEDYDKYLKEQLGEDKFKEYKDYLEDPTALDLRGTPDESIAKREILSENYQRLLRDVDEEGVQDDLKIFIPGKKFEKPEDQILYFGALQNGLENKVSIIKGLKQEYDIIDKKYKFKNSIENLNKAFYKLNSKYTNGVNADSSPEDIKEYNNLVKEHENINEKIKETGINELANTIDSYQEEYLSDFNDFVKKSEYIENSEIAKAALDMDYRLSTRLLLKTEEFMIGGLEGLIGGVADITASIAESDTINPFVIWNAPVKAARSVSDYATARAEERQKYMAAKLPTTLTYDDLEKGASFGDMALEMFADNAASTALSLVPVGAGFNAARGLASTARALAWRQAVKQAGNITSATFFISAAGNKYNELGVLENNALSNKLALEAEISRTIDPTQRRALLKELDIYDRALDRSTAAKAFSAFTHGLIEFGAEKLGTIGYISRLQDASVLLGKKQFRKYLGKSGTKILDTGYKAGLGATIEVLEETVTQLGQNGVDIVVLGDNKSLIDGINKEFFTSTVISSLAISGPNMGQNLYNIFSDQVKLRTEIKNNRKLFTEYYKLQKEKYSFNNNTAARKKILARQKEILKEASFNSAASIMKLNRLSENQIKELFEINRKIQAEVKEAGDIGAQGLKPNEKRTVSILNDTESRIENLVKRKEEILNIQNRLNENKINSVKNLSEVDKAKLAYLLNFQQFHDDLLEHNLKKDTKIYRAATLEDLLPQITNLSLKELSEKEGVINDYIKLNILSKDKNIDDASKQLLINEANEYLKSAGLTNDQINIIRTWEGGNAGIESNAIVINESIRFNELVSAAKSGNTEGKFAAVAASHELLHLRTADSGLLNESGLIKDNFKSAVLGIKDILAEKLEFSKISKEDYDMLINRANRYEQLNKGVSVEELINLYNDASNLGIIDINDIDINYEIKNLLNSVSEFVFGESSQFLRFETAEDVIHYIRKFNKDIRASKLNLGIEPESEKKLSLADNIQEKINQLEDQLIDQTIDYDLYESKMAQLEKQLELAEKQETAEKKKPKKKEDKKDETLKQATVKSKKILDDIGNAPDGFNKNNPKIYEVLEGMIKSKSKAFRTASGNVVNLTNLPGFEMENMVSETIASLIPMINKFDPKRNDSLFGYLNSQLSNRMRAALKTGKVAEGKFTEDVTEVKGLATEETTIREPEKPKYTKIMDADVFDTDVINAVSAKVLSTVRVLKNKLNVALGKNQNTSPLIAEILGDISTQADIDIKKAMGGKEGGMLRKFLLKNKQAIIENLTTTFLMGKDRGNEVLGGLPIAIQKQVNGKFLSYPDWVGKKIDRETTLKRGATAGNQIVRRVAADKISNDDYISFFLDPTGSPIRGRKEALAKEISGELGLELFVEAIKAGDGPIFDAFENNRNAMGEVLANHYASEVVKQVERGTVKFSLGSDIIFETFNALTERTRTDKKAAIKAIYKKYPKYAEEIKKVIVDPYKDLFEDINKLVREAKEKDIRTNRGIVYEEKFKKAFRIAAKNIDGLNIQSIKVGEGGVDITYSYKRVKYGIELKYNSDARISSTTVKGISNILSNQKPELTISTRFNDYIIDTLYNRKEIKKYIDTVISDEVGGKIENGDIYISPAGLELMKTKYENIFKEAKVEIPIEYSFIADIYNKNKAIAVNTIQFLDIGAFWMNDNIMNVENMPEFATYTKDKYGNEIEDKGILSKGAFITDRADSREDGRTVKLIYKLTNFIPIEYRNKLSKKSVYNLSAGLGIETMFKNANPINKNSISSISKNLAVGQILNPSKNPKGISIWDFDDTLATTKSNVLYTLPGGIKGKLNAEEFAKRGDELLEKGAEFDFSEFSKVMSGAKGPMFDKAIARNKKFGNDNVYILTARPANSATAIHEFLSNIGLDIKLENIVGLGDSSAQAKAEWVINKVSEGYNDFYFADDAYKNVKAVQDVLEVADVKSKVQQANIKFSLASDPKMLDKEFNLMLQRSKGVPAQSVISKARAEQLGKGKGKFDLFLPPNAEDFQGLLYKFLGKGKQGDADMKFFKDNLITPFNIAENAISTFRQKLADNLKILNKELGNIDKDIDNETIDKIEKTGFTPDQAVRIYIWNRLGQEIPDVTTQEKAQVLGIVRRNAKLMSYAKQLMSITEQFGGYPPPSKNWFASNSKGDLYQYANENVRAKYLENWQANADAIFNNENLTKLQSIYGKDFVNQLKEVLRRMKAGSNRPLNLNDSGSKMLDYINGSIGTIMFLNMRSAVLQTISAVNFLNWHDNNLFAAGKTLADPKNFTKTFMEIMNSDFLKQRRDGLEINVTEAEIAKAVEQSKNKAKAIFSSIIKFGYKPTQFADSFAIAVGGTSFLINRTKTYENQGMSFKDAREAAFNDFREIAEENQQSSRTDKTSNIQASNLGRLVFAFNNTPFQYTRIMKKAALDLVNKRGDWKTNISKIIYYGAIQNMVFFALQQAYMAFLFGADEEDEDMDSRKYRLLNGSIDSILRGSGLPGAIISTVKNTVLEYVKQEEKGDWRSDHGKTVVQALNLSPPIGSKVGRILSALEGKKYEETTLDVLRNKSKLVSAVTNVPLDRVVTKIDNMRVAVNEPIETWKRAALLFGWDQWSLGVYDDLDAIKGAKKDGKSKKTRSEIMKEVWRKRKEEDKKTRDSLITVRSKMSASESLKSLEQEILKKQKKK